MVIHYFLLFPSWECISSPLKSRLVCDLPWQRGHEDRGICDFQVWEVTYAKRPAASVALSTGETLLGNLALRVEQPCGREPEHQQRACWLPHRWGWQTGATRHSSISRWLQLQEWPQVGSTKTCPAATSPNCQNVSKRRLCFKSLNFGVIVQQQLTARAVLKII